MAIIHHSGNVVGQTTQGHYRADDKNRDTRNWYNDAPENLSAKGQTKMGYIFLYRKTNRVAVENDVPPNIPEDVVSFLTK